MFPIIFSYGSFELRTLSIFLVVAFLLSSFIYWRKGKEEHYGEGEFFDGFILATLVGFVVGRIGFIAFNFSRFGFSLVQWLDIFAYPGVSGGVAIIAASVYLYHFAAKNKWDVFEVLDFWVVALSGSLAVANIGMFFDGTNAGTITHLPIGVVFPGLVEPRHPVQLYSAVFFLIMTIYLSKVEYRYRTFEWYRAGKKTAQTGFLLSVFVIAVSLFYFVCSWVKPAVISIIGIDIDRIVAFGGFITGLFLLYSRSGRGIATKQRRTIVTAPTTGGIPLQKTAVS